MTPKRSDAEAFRAGTFIFSFIAVILAMAAVVTAGMAYSHTDTVSRRLDKVATGGAIGSTAKVTLQEFAIKVSPALVKAGTVRLDVTNVGGMTHEMVLVRAPSVQALPIVATAGERSVGAVDEEAIAESAKVGETGDVKVQAHVSKQFHLTAGTYVMFCNIDNIAKDKSVTNHFVKGMVATLTVV
jgi:hypothetical protein